MKQEMKSSRYDTVIQIYPSKRRSHKSSKIFEENLSYQPIVEEIVQEIQFTYTPLAEKKTRRMITESNSTG